MTGGALLADLVSFGRLLRSGGAEVGPGRLADAVRGLAAVGLADRRDVYFTLRQTLVSHREELELFDRAFALWSGRDDGLEEHEELRPVPVPETSRRAKREDGGDGEEREGEAHAREAPRSSRSCAARTSRSSTRTRSRR